MTLTSGNLIEKYLKISNNNAISYYVFKSKCHSNKQINIIFIHGLGGNKLVFVDFINEILNSSNRKIDLNAIIVDLVGHGKSINFNNLEKYSYISQSNFIKKIIDAEFEKHAKLNIFGHCYGSFVAIKLANMINYRVNQLFLVASNPYIRESTKLQFRVSRNLFVKYLIYTVFKVAKSDKNLQDFDYKEYKYSQDYDIKRLFTDVKYTSIKGYLGSLYQLLYSSVFDDYKELQRIGMPICLIHGKKDKIFPYNEILHNTKKDKIELIPINKSNHLPVFNSIRMLSDILIHKLMKE
ncbi:MAG: alpha/beta fold hydrolase [Proteobacteria bacterium]|nr:alpha/beta fold hydrolase [Pseudomonadota bacterium]